MQMVEFKVKLEPEWNQHRLYRAVQYSAQFINKDGSLIEVRKSSRLHSAFLGESLATAWLLSSIIRDFMTETMTG